MHGAPTWRARLAGPARALVALAAGSALVLTLFRPAGPVSADGPAPCSTGGPPFPYHGFCATYSGANTWYGSYGPGFPTAQGWAFCADPPASGGDYPVPGYGYVPGGAPPGASTASLGPLGFAFGQAQAVGWWDGSPGQFTADQAAAAGKLLYDALVWGSPVPAMDPGVLAAYDDLAGWEGQAVGLTGPPQLSVGLVGGGTTFPGQGRDEIHVAFPGTGRGLVGLGVLMSITNGSFDSAGGPTFIGVSTDGGGNAVVPIYADGPGTVSVTVSAATRVGQPGIGFYWATAGPANAQQLAGFPAPVDLAANQQLWSVTPPPDGTLSVEKAGDDEAYVGVGGAVFDVEQSGAVVAVLTTGPTGATPTTPPLAVGTYTVHEVTPPPGYLPAPDQTATVVSGTNTVVNFSGPAVEHVVPATVTLAKADAETGAPLGGAVFDVRYDENDRGVYNDDLGTCTTGAGGTCSPPGNDGGALLPGDYQVTEVSAPTGYYLDPADAVQTLTLAPGEHGTVRFADELLGSLRIQKRGDDAPYAPIAGAVFTAAGPAPSTAVVGTMTVATDGSSNTLSGLVPGTYTVTEVTPPPGYQAIAPVQVAVAEGSATTVLDVTDHVQPATLGLEKVDRATGAPLAGAVLDVRFDPSGTGSYSVDLGTCTTTASGGCSVTGNDGPAAFLPGDYQVTEVQAPPGYELDPTSDVTTVTLRPGAPGTVRFTDPRLVAASFQKVSTGNVDPNQVQLAGAVIDVDAASAPSTTVASCTTDAAGRCTTAPVLVSGTGYCWTEVSAPPGLQAGANGCFVAADGQAAQPITVTDPGEFVAVTAKKVDAAAPSLGLPGAVFDLYRVDGGKGPDHPSPPSGAPSEPGATWVARATSGDDGQASFPLQFPGFAYCVVEEDAPANYVTDQTEHCTPVLTGSPASPPTTVTVTVDDAEALVELAAHKYNSLSPDTGIPGAVYDLYVEGGPPPSGVLSSPPPDVAPEPGDTWYARGTTNPYGQLRFVVPAGHAWCLREVSAPLDYVPDPSLHCTAVLDAGAPVATNTVALPETLATVHLAAYKYNSLEPRTVIPDATYELLVEGTPPPTDHEPVAPAGVPVPAGDEYWAEGTTDAAGRLSFAVPAGYAWCLHELSAPAVYQPDPTFHCTAVITTDSPAAAATIALPEVPAAAQLAFTGEDLAPPLVAGVLLVGAGVALAAVFRRRGGRPGGRRRGGPEPGGGPRRPASPRPTGVGRGGPLAVGVAVVGLVAAGATVWSAPRAAADPTTPVWWAPVPSSYFQLGDIYDLSCAAPTMCVDVGPQLTSPPSFAALFDGHHWSPAGTDASQLSAVSCPSTSFCMALDYWGDFVTYDGNTWSAPQQTTDYSSTGSFLGGEVSCPTPASCLAVDDRGSVVTWTAAGGWGTPRVLLSWHSAYPDVQPTISCPAPTDCVVVVGETAFTYDGSVWSTGTPVSGSPLARVSCPTTMWCLAVDVAGNAWVDTDGQWSTSATSLDPDGLVLASCSSPSLCLAVDQEWRVLVERDGTWSSPSEPIDGGMVTEAGCVPTSGWCTTLGARVDPPGSVSDLESMVFGAPLAPVAGLAADPASTTAGPGNQATVAITPSGTGFVGLAGPDAWQATYQWTCRDLAGAPACPAASGTWSVPADDRAGDFSGSPQDGAAPADTPPFDEALSPGSYSVVVHFADTTSGAATSASTTVTVEPAPCTPQITAVAGGGSAQVGTAFAAPLVAKVTCGGVPVEGDTVRFSLPGDGPSGTFPGGLEEASASTQADGTATSPSLTADETAGAWTATAAVSDVGGSAAFALTNRAPGTTTTGPAPPSNQARRAAPRLIAATTAAAGTTLAYTGGPGLPLPAAGAGLVGAGAVVLATSRRRRRVRGGQTHRSAPRQTGGPPTRRIEDRHGPC